MFGPRHNVMRMGNSRAATRKLSGLGMHIRTLGTARIQHRETGEVYDLDPDDLEWEVAGSSEEPMGAEIEHRARLIHADLGELSWSLWEYPEGFENHQSYQLNGHLLLENFDISLEHDRDDEEPISDDERYYTEEDYRGITREEFAKLAGDDQVEYMVAWFHRYYEDPVHGMPYQSREGGYQYIYGGPYDAESELSNEFGTAAKDEALARAVDTIQEDGTVNWAPSPRHPNRANDNSEHEVSLEERLSTIAAALEGDAVPTFGSVEERAGRAEVAKAIQQVEAQLLAPAQADGGIGHNNPPDDKRLNQDKMRTIRVSITIVKREIAEQQPDALEVAKAAGALHKVVQRLGEYADLAGAEFSKGAGKTAGEEFGKGAGKALKWALYSGLVYLVDTVTGWLDLVLGLLR